MLTTVLRLAALPRVVDRVRLYAADVTERATRELKQKAADAGITIGLAFGGLIFALVALFCALAALYLWLETWYGPYVALGTVGLISLLAAALLFTVAATRGGSRRPNPPQATLTRLDARPPPATIDGVVRQMTGRTAAAADEALDATAKFVRDSPRERIFGAMALALLVGVVLGRRR